MSVFVLLTPDTIEAVAGVCTLEKYDLTSYGKHGRAKEGVRTRDK